MSRTGRFHFGGLAGTHFMNGFLDNVKTFGKQFYSGLKDIKTFRLSSLRKVFSLMDKKEKTVLLVLLGVALISFCWSVANFYYAHTTAMPGFGGTYTEGLIGQPTYINPLLANQDPDLTLTKLIFSGLYKYNNNGQLVPDLALAMPSISEDQKQYTIKLRNDVKWHNGRQFTADDVVFTIQTLKDPAYKSPYRNLWLYTNVQKLNDYEVKFTTHDVSGPFINNLTLPILPKFVWNNVNSQNFLLSKSNLEAVGTGPYAIKEIKKLASGKILSLTLQSFSNFYGGKPKIDTVIFKFFDNEYDMLNALHSKTVSGLGFMPFTSSLYLEPKQNQLQILKIPLPQYQVAFFNLNNPILSDLKVRQALTEAIDKQKIIDDVFKGQALLPSSPFVFLGQASQVKDNSQPNLDDAKKLLDSAGWIIDPQSNIRRKKNQDLALTISTNDMATNSKAAGDLADQWKQLGIKITLNVLPTKDLTEKNIRPRNFDVLVFFQKFDADPDSFLFWHSSQIKDPGLNLTGFNNPQADKLIVEARTTTNQSVREQKYLQLDQLITQNFPAIFLNQDMYVYAVDKDIKNIGLKVLYDPSQRMLDIPNWYISEQRVWK